MITEPPWDCNDNGQNFGSGDWNSESDKHPSNESENAFLIEQKVLEFILRLRSNFGINECIVVA